MLREDGVLEQLLVTNRGVFVVDGTGITVIGGNGELLQHTLLKGTVVLDGQGIIATHRYVIQLVIMEALVLLQINASVLLETQGDFVNKSHAHI